MNNNNIRERFTPNVGLHDANPDLVGLQCGYRTPHGKPKRNVINWASVRALTLYGQRTKKHPNVTMKSFTYITCAAQSSIF